MEENELVSAVYQVLETHEGTHRFKNNRIGWLSTTDALQKVGLFSCTQSLSRTE